MTQTHQINVSVEEYTQDGFDNESMRVLAQDVANFAAIRAASLGLMITPPVALYYRLEDGDESKFLDIFEGTTK